MSAHNYDDVHQLGVKIQGNIIAIEPADLFADVSRYDMIINDRLTDSYNGNNCYQCDIQMVNPAQKHFNVNGWDLLYIYFDGNWFGQTGECIITDKFGKRTKCFGCGTIKWYWTQYDAMLKKCLAEFISFANDNYCADEVILKKSPQAFKDIYSLNGIADAVSEINNYMGVFNDVKEKIMADAELSTEQKELYVDRITRTVKKNINDCIGCNIK